MTPREITEAIAQSEDLIQFVTTPARGYALIGALQLALRHPDIPENVARVCHQLVFNMTEAIVTTLNLPDFETLVNWGYHPEADLTPEQHTALFDLDINEIRALLETLDPKPESN